MQTRQDINTSESEEYLRKQKLFAALYLSGLKQTEDFMEFLTHLDFETIEKIAAAANTTLLDREYNK